MSNDSTKFDLRASPDGFAAWLHSYFTDDVPDRIEVLRNENTVGRVRLNWRAGADQRTGERRVIWRGDYVLATYDNSGRAKKLEGLTSAFDPPTFLTFRIVELHNERIQVKVTNHDPVTAGVFDRVCRAIRATWGIPEHAKTSADDADAVDQKPWERIADKNRDRQILELFWGDMTASEIGRQTHMSPGSVRNILAELRKEYGVKIVPYKSEITKRRDT